VLKEHMGLGPIGSLGQGIDRFPQHVLRHQQRLGDGVGPGDGPSRQGVPRLTHGQEIAGSHQDHGAFGVP
jgi:hypothetical protein